MNCACPATKFNIFCLRFGFELLHRAFKRQSYYFDSGKEGPDREHVCTAFTKPAALEFEALKSLFTVEQCEILVALQLAVL